MSIHSLLESFQQSNDRIYTAEIDHILEFMYVYYEQRVENGLFLGEVRTKEILLSLISIVDNGLYNKKEMARKYRSAISSLFKYLVRNKFVNNPYLYHELTTSSLFSDSYNYQVNTYISENKNLIESEPNRIFKQYEIDTLIEECNLLFNIYESDINLVHYSELAACISIKLMILTGAKYEALYGLQYSSYENKAITINGYKIHLPIGLSSQIELYLEALLREKSRIPAALFYKRSGQPWGKKTCEGPISYTISKMLGTTSTSGAYQYGISKLIEVDTSETEITHMTCAKHKVVSNCVVKRDFTEKENYINIHIEKTGMLEWI